MTFLTALMLSHCLDAWKHTEQPWLFCWIAPQGESALNFLKKGQFNSAKKSRRPRWQDRLRYTETKHWCPWPSLDWEYSSNTCLLSRRTKGQNRKEPKSKSWFMRISEKTLLLNNLMQKMKRVEMKLNWQHMTEGRATIKKNRLWWSLAITTKCLRLKKTEKATW